MDEIGKEIDKLKQKQQMISSKLSFINDFNEKEELEEELSKISSQIKMLENYKKRFGI